jgi:hypothetical protein
MYPPSTAPTLNSRLQAIRKTTVAFASLFKDIPFIKYDDNGNEIDKIKVPIIYGNKEKYVKRQDIAHEKVQITLPRIEYGLIDMIYDPSRRTNHANKISGCSSNKTVYVNSPLPYNFNFEIVLYTRNVEDANQIMEYILPFFYPDYNMKLNFVPEAGIIKNVPITFLGESEDQNSTGSYDDPVRSVFRTLNFTARSYIFQPPKYVKPILQAETNVIVPSSINEYTVNSGSGSFVVGESVYQGSSYDRSTGAGIVDSWNPNSNKLGISIIRGKFVANSSISNLRGTTTYNILSTPNSGLAYSYVITPTPDTYPVDGPYDYNIEITDYTA